MGQVNALGLSQSQARYAYTEKLKAKITQQNEVNQGKHNLNAQSSGQPIQYPKPLTLNPLIESRPGDGVISSHFAGDLVISESYRNRDERKQQRDEQKVEQLRQQDEQNKGYVWFVRCEKKDTLLS